MNEPCQEKHIIGHVPTANQIWIRTNHVIVVRKIPLGITNWSRKVVMKMSTTRDLKRATFVCIDDISETIEPLNHVIYNPSKDSKRKRVNRLYDIVKQRFDVELSSEQLEHLTKFETTELTQFVHELKEIISNSNKK